MQTVSFGFIGLFALPILPIRGRFLFAKGMITKHFSAILEFTKGAFQRDLRHV
jgi:hypothetical protein